MLVRFYLPYDIKINLKSRLRHENVMILLYIHNIALVIIT